MPILQLGTVTALVENHLAPVNAGTNLTNDTEIFGLFAQWNVVAVIRHAGRKCIPSSRVGKVDPAFAGSQLVLYGDHKENYPRADHCAFLSPIPLRRSGFPQPESRAATVTPPLCPSFRRSAPKSVFGGGAHLVWAGLHRERTCWCRSGS